MGKKRGPRGQGSVHYLRNEGVWRAVGYAQTPGGPVKVARKRRLQGDAIRALDAAIDGLENPKPRLDETMLGEYLEDWLHGTARANVAPTTYSRYERAVRLYLLPFLENVRLVEATAADVRRWKQAMIDKGYAAGTVRHAQGILSNALNQAVADGILTRNPSALVKKAKERGRKMRMLSAEQAARLVEVVKGTRHEALYLVALKLGPRQSELAALKWEDVNLENGTVLVWRSVDTHGAGNIWGFTKTGEGRTIKLPVGVVESLERHRSLQLEERLATRGWEDMGLVFPNRKGRVNRRTTLMRDFHRHLEQAGLPRVRFHDLRHTAGSLMLATGIPIPTVSQILGHKNPTQTLNTYAHVLADMQDVAARRLDESLPF